MENHVLDIKDLAISFSIKGKHYNAINSVNLHVNSGEVLGIVGESGCGKSVTSLSVMGLLSTPPARIEKGQILFEGDDLLLYSDKKMQQVRGNKISMIFQEPMTSLNPIFTIGHQVGEAIRLHTDNMSRTEIKEKTLEMLKAVGITAPERTYRSFPYQLSGGMRQRVMIAMALACKPRLLIADEPTTALDVTIQAQVLELMKKLQHEMGSSILFITHDLGVVAEMCDRVAVMYSGYIVEEANVSDLFHNPLHPYTQGLLASMPRLDDQQETLHTIAGSVPHLSERPKGCPFHPRCPYATDQCRAEMAPEKLLDGHHSVRCWRQQNNSTAEYEKE